MKIAEVRPSFFGVCLTTISVLFAMPANSKPERFDDWSREIVNVDKCRPEEFRELWDGYKRGELDSSIYISILVIFGNLAIFRPIDDDSVFNNRKALATILVFDKNLSKKGVLARKKFFRLGIFDYLLNDNYWENQKEMCISNWNEECMRLAIDNDIIFERKNITDKIDRGINEGNIPYCRSR